MVLKILLVMEYMVFMLMIKLFILDRLRTFVEDL